MRGRLFLVVLALLMSALAPVHAQDTDAIRIDWPPPAYFLQGTVTVTGSAAPANLQSFFLEVAPWSESPTGWIPVTLPARTPVSNGALGQWDTTLLEDGIYILRLSVTLTDNSRTYATSGPLRVGNLLQIPSGEPKFRPANLCRLSRFQQLNLRLPLRRRWCRAHKWSMN